MNKYDFCPTCGVSTKLHMELQQQVAELTARAEQAEVRGKILMDALTAAKEFLPRVDSLPKTSTRIGEVTMMVIKALAGENPSNA